MLFEGLSDKSTSLALSVLEVHNEKVHDLCSDGDLISGVPAFAEFEINSLDEGIQVRFCTDMQGVNIILTFLVSHVTSILLCNGIRLFSLSCSFLCVLNRHSTTRKRAPQNLYLSMSLLLIFNEATVGISFPLYRNVNNKSKLYSISNGNFFQCST